MHNLDKQLHRRLPIILTKCIANNRCYLVLKNRFLATRNFSHVENMGNILTYHKITKEFKGDN